MEEEGCSRGLGWKLGDGESLLYWLYGDSHQCSICWEGWGLAPLIGDDPLTGDEKFWSGGLLIHVS